MNAFYEALAGIMRNWRDDVKQINQQLADENRLADLEDERENLIFEISEWTRKAQYAELDSDIRTWSDEELTSYETAVWALGEAHDALTKWDEKHGEELKRLREQQ